MWDRGWGEYGKANFFPLAEPGYPQGEEELGPHPFGASVKGVCGAKKVGAGRVEHTAKCVKDVPRFGGTVGTSHVKEGRDGRSLPRLFLNPLRRAAASWTKGRSG